MANKVTTFVCPYFLIAIGFLMPLASCSQTGPTARTDDVQNVEHPNGEVASYKVQLEIRQGKCVFNYDGPFKGQIETNFLAPCEFLRDPAGKIRQMEMKNTRQNGGGIYSVILVIGGPPAKGGHSDKYMPNGCGSEARAASLSERGVLLGSVGNGVDLCPTSSFDEKFLTANSVHV